MTLNLTTARKNVNIDNAFHYLVTHIMKITKNMNVQNQGQNALGDHSKTDLNVVGTSSDSSKFANNFDKKYQKEEKPEDKKGVGCCGA